MGLPEKGWREESKATDLNKAMWDVGGGASKHSWEFLLSCSHSAKSRANSGFPHSEDIDAELLESMASSSQPVFLTHPSTCVSSGYPRGHQMSLATILCMCLCPISL